MINIGLLGCGVWGRNYIRNFEHLDNINVNYCCDFEDKNLNQARRLMPDMMVTKEPDDVLNDTEINAVIVATPANKHYEHVKSALEQNKHVLVEKPMALNSKEAKELIDIAKNNNKVLMVGHIMEYNSAVIKMKNLISNEQFGEIHYLYLTRTNFGRIRSDVNVLWDLAPHDISIVNFLLDKNPKYVSARGASYIQQDVEDVVFIYLKYDDNVVVSIHLSWLDPCKIRKVTVIGDQKMAVFDDLESTDKIRVYDKGISYDPKDEKTYDDFGTYQFSYRYGDIMIPQFEMTEPLRSQCSHFIECINSGTTPKTDGDNGLRVVRILEAAEESLRNDGKNIQI